MSNLNDLTIIIVTFKTKDEILFNCINSIKKVFIKSVMQKIVKIKENLVIV